MDRKRYLKIFKNLDEYETQKDNVLGKPSISLLRDVNKLKFRVSYAIIYGTILRFFKNTDVQNEELLISNDDTISGEILTLNDN